MWQENDAEIIKITEKVKTTRNDEKNHYKITIFWAYAPYPRLMYWIASSISQGKKMTCHQNPGLDDDDDDDDDDCE